MIFDTHCHLNDEKLIQNVDEIIKNAQEVGVNRFLVIGWDKESSLTAIKLAEQYEGVYAAIGFHPENIFDATEDDFQETMKYIDHPKVVAVGEIGLDYHYEGYNKDHQKELFIKQLKLAEKYDLPVVIHSREATQDTIDILKQFKLKGVIHSFSGSYETAQIYINMGYKLGINGIITFKNSNLSNTISRLNPADIVLETDSPYLTPEPFRGQKNESKNIIYIAEKVASIYDISLEKLSEITNKNVKQIFDI